MLCQQHIDFPFKHTAIYRLGGLLYTCRAQPVGTGAIPPCLVLTLNEPSLDQ